MNNRSLLYSGAAVSVSLLLQSLGGLLGLFGMAFTLFSPLPTAFIVLTCGIGYGAIVVTLTTVGLLFLSGEGVSVAGVYLLQYGIGGLVLGALLRTRWHWDRAIIGTLLVNISCAALVLGVVSFNLQSGPLELIDTFVQREIITVSAVYETTDLTPQQQRDVAAVLDSVRNVLQRIFPGLTIAVSGAVLLLTVCGLTLVGGGRYTITGPAFEQWKAPEPAIWVLIFSGFMSFFLTGAAQSVALNLLTVILPIYFVQGVAIVRCFFRRRNVPGFIQGISYVLILFLNPLPLIVTGFGVFDLWADFRKPRNKKPGE
ncbi:MAG: YybS family protein [Desulfuromonadaceae bacterium]|nr:YybS family protein [Desulfuromonadaceae bacterium]